MGTAGAMPLPEDQAGQSFISRLVGVFLSPGETFEDIVRKPDFILPILVGIVVVVASAEIALSRIDMAAAVRWGLEHSSRASTMSADQMDQAVTSMTKFYTVGGHVAGVLRVPVVALVLGLIGMLVANLVFGAKVSYKTSLSIASYAYLVNIPYALISTVMVLVGDPQHMVSNPTNPAPTSVGFFLDPSTVPKGLLSAGTDIELFKFWFLWLLAVGFAAAIGKRTKASSVFFAFLAIWAVWTLIFVGLASLG